MTPRVTETHLNGKPAARTRPVDSNQAATESFARQFGLAIARDACGDLIIPAKKGHLYFGSGQLCWAVVEGGPWDLRGIMVWLRPHCQSVIGAEGEAIFHGIPVRFWGRVVVESGATKIVRKQPCKSLVPRDATRFQTCGAINQDLAEPLRCLAGHDQLPEI